MGVLLLFPCDVFADVFDGREFSTRDEDLHRQRTPIGQEYREHLRSQHRWEYFGGVLCRVYPDSTAWHPTEYRFDGGFEHGDRMFPRS